METERDDLTRKNGTEQGGYIAFSIPLIIAGIVYFAVKKTVTNNSNDLGNLTKELIKTGADNRVDKMDITIENNPSFKIGGDTIFPSPTAEVSNNQKISISVKYR